MVVVTQRIAIAPISFPSRTKILELSWLNSSELNLKEPKTACFQKCSVNQTKKNLKNQRLGWKIFAIKKVWKVRTKVTTISLTLIISMQSWVRLFLSSSMLNRIGKNSSFVYYLSQALKSRWFHTLLNKAQMKKSKRWDINQQPT